MSLKFKVTTFKDSEASFRLTLNQYEIPNSRIYQLSEGPMAAGITVEIILTGGYGLLAVACLAWASVKKSRKINITTKDNKVIWLEGYSADDAAKILESAKNIAVIETKSDGKA
ncbi:hypothetical protein [Cycloclasticus sp.]|jgi:hypothetical protein|uniref:hypothetical protein n=1 Tax=Cycloclasticus sp. TaxID=2024830 RepID=UPI000C1135BA|nr:hypothetical protein [Cycloclasticus sp.]PHR48633.1 MAG: hypothetical protein COA48_10080 [Cycloclasticus sp.]